MPQPHATMHQRRPSCNLPTPHALCISHGISMSIQCVTASGTSERLFLSSLIRSSTIAAWHAMRHTQTAGHAHSSFTSITCHPNCVGKGRSNAPGSAEKAALSNSGAIEPRLNFSSPGRPRNICSFASGRFLAEPQVDLAMAILRME